jgi:hypothetical protein
MLIVQYSIVKRSVKVKTVISMINCSSGIDDNTVDTSDVGPGTGSDTGGDKSGEITKM